MMRVIPFVLAAGILADAQLARACSDGAEQVVAWDLRDDMAVVAQYGGRDRLPPRGATARPEVYALRRISTGERVAQQECTEQGACDYREAFSHSPDGWQAPASHGPPPVRVRRRLVDKRQEFSLEVPGKGGWRHLAWLDFVAADAGQRLYSVVAHARDGNTDDVVVALQYHARGGGCSRTVAQVLRFPARDLADPRNPARQRTLLANVRQDALLPHWRTVAELGPLPPNRLLDVLELAEGAGYPAWGARWWREATTSLPAAQVAALTVEFRRRRGLDRTRQVLGNKL
jgi:hypothetical protein